MKIMKRVYSFLLSVLSMVLCMGCIYDFSPEELDIDMENFEFIVIDGDITPGDYTYVKIYKSVPLESEDRMEYIANANVWVENSAGERWIGTLNYDYSSGQYIGLEYVINTTGLPLDGEYKLCADISGRGIYESELMPVMVTPDIDSITFSIGADSTELYIEATTHFDSDEPLYCKWDYDSDWEFKTYHRPELSYSNVMGMHYLTPEAKQQMYYCWGKESSTDVYIASSENLSENLLYKQRLNTIHYKDNKLNSLYSTLVTQRRLSKNGYIYWNNIKKSSSQMGGLFSPQPSEVRGNITNLSNPKEKVLGFISVATTVSKRLYITRMEAGIYDPNPDGICNPVLYGINFWSNVVGAGLLPIDYLTNESGMPDFNNAFWTTGKCVDCRLEGSKQRPSYWPNDHF